MDKINKKNHIIETNYDLTQYFIDGCKSPDEWKIGTEHEKFCFSNKSFLPLKYDGDCSIKNILIYLKDHCGWKEINEGPFIIGLEKNNAKITLEPGGQLELSGALLENIHQTSQEVKNHLIDLENFKKIEFHLGIEFQFGIMMTCQKCQKEDTLMTLYGKVGKHGKKMMYRTCTIQVNLDFSSEKDMKKKLRVGFALQPIVTAFLFITF